MDDCHHVSLLLGTVFYVRGACFHHDAGMAEMEISPISFS
jgi:hypothetical protein